MISQFYQNSSTKVLVAIVALFCLVSYSCKETKDSVESNKTVVKVNLLGVANPIADEPAKKGKATAGSDQSVQVSTVPFSNSGSFKVTLTAAGNPSNGLRASGSNRAATGAVHTPLDQNVQYKVLVYDSNGDYVTEKVYTNGTDNSMGIELDAGKTYSFIAYSVNSTTAVPTVSGANKLSTATLANIDSDLMYFFGALTLAAGDNNLNVILKHQYSQIITRIKMNPTTTGSITNITASAIKPSHISANLKLSDGTLTYNGLNQAGVNVVFPALGAGLREVTSTPTMLIHEKATSGELTIGSITIDGVTKSNLKIPQLNIIPGQRYVLDLDFNTCTQDVVGGADMDWNYQNVSPGGINVNGVFKPNGSILETSFTAPGADYGFVFDILKLDNSFNMEVNGVKLAQKEIQFQSGNATLPQNIKFEDGSEFSGNNTQGGTVTHIYSMTGTAAAPLVKVVISRLGEVKMYASKVSGGPLFPLVLSNGNAFNKFTWNGGAQSNAVKLTQMVIGTTALKGSGSGVKKVSCNLVK